MSFNINKLVQPECGGPNPLVAAAQQITMKPSAALTSLSSRHRHQQPTKQDLNLSDEFVKRDTPSTYGSTKYSAPTFADVLGRTQMNIQSLSLTSAPHQQQYQIANVSTMANNHPHPSIINQYLNSRLSEFHQQRPFDSRLYDNMAASTSAGDQLETKYRNDMISQTSSTKAEKIGQEKLNDDLLFWQSLSQSYLGPNTYNNIAVSRAGRSDQKKNELKDAEQKSIPNSDIEAERELTEAEIQSFIDAANAVEEVKLNHTEYVFDERNPLKDQFEDPFAEGLKRLEQGDIPSAALLFEAAVQNDPKNSTAWRYLGTTQAQNEKDMSAIRALTNCLQIDPNDQEARLAISVSLANESLQQQACKYLLEWLVNNDRYKSVNANLADYDRITSEMSSAFTLSYESNRGYDYVKDKFIQAARMSPNNPDPEVQNSLGVLFNMRGEYDKAVDCFKTALSVRSNDSLLWNRLGATLANGLKSDEAVIAYRRALEISPGFLRSRYNLAISLIHLNSYDEAAKQLVQILNMQAAGKGTKNMQIRTRSITSTSIWNTLRTVSTLMNQPELYAIIDGRDLAQCNEAIMRNTNEPTNRR